jgi:predicted DNA-binding transcriptional regulator YafY
MQIERQWQILRTIPDKVNRRSTDEIWSMVCNEPENTGVSKRTIERDLAFLQSLFPIEQKTEGRTNYWYWASGVSMWLPGLTEDEALAFHMVERNMHHLLPEGALERMAPYFKVARGKLAAKSMQSRPGTQKFRLVSSGIPRVSRKIVNIEASRTVRQALLNDQQLCITHWNETSQDLKDTHSAVINPLSLVQIDGELFLIYTHIGSQEPESIALREIDTAQFSMGAFEGPLDFDIDAYLKSGALNFAKHLPLPIGDWIRLSASFSPDAVTRLYNAPIAPIVAHAEEADGWRRLALPVRFTAALAEWLLGLGPNVRVHQPAALRRWLGDQLREAAARYAGESADETPQRAFRWFEKWASLDLICSHCEWQGKAQTKLLEVADDEEPGNSEFRCPDCNKLLVRINYSASQQDIEKNWNQLDPWMKAVILSTPERMERFESDRLKSTDQMPKLQHSGPNFLTWGIMRHSEGELSTTVKHGSQLIWIQPALWNGAEEFMRVARLLENCFAKRINTIRISPDAWGYLGPDTEETRRRVKAACRF